MGLISLSSSFNINLSTILSISDLKSRYLAGLPIPSEITEESIQFFIDSSVSELENILSLRFRKQIIREEKHFGNTDWQAWGFINTTFPVVCPIALDGYLGTVRQVSYPKDWMSARKTNDNRNYSRMLNIVPTQGTVDGGAVYTGIVPLISGALNNSRQIPNYWTIEYVTGWDKVPSEILDCIGVS